MGLPGRQIKFDEIFSRVPTTDGHLATTKTALTLASRGKKNSSRSGFTPQQAAGIIRNMRNTNKHKD